MIVKTMGPIMRMPQKIALRSYVGSGGIVVKG